MARKNSNGTAKPESKVILTISDTPAPVATIPGKIVNTETEEGFTLTEHRTTDPVVDDAIANVLGVGGEPTVPAITVSTTEAAWNVSAAIRAALQEMGTDTPRDAVVAHIDRHHPGHPAFNQQSFANSLSVIRTKMRNGNGGTTQVKGVDLTDTVRLCQSLKLSPKELFIMLNEIAAVGTVQGIQIALTQVIVVAELMNAGKTV